jgi:hypothetical protein
MRRAVSAFMARSCSRRASSSLRTRQRVGHFTPCGFLAPPASPQRQRQRRQRRVNGSKGFRRRRVGGAWEVGRRGPLPLRPLRLQPRLQRRLPRKLRRTRALRAMGDDRRGCRASPRRGGAASAARGTSVDADAPALPLFLWAQASPPRPFWPQRPRPRPRPPFWPAPCPPQRASRQRASRLRGVCGSRGEGRGVSV